MSTLITRLYANAHDAEKAATALKAKKLPAGNIDIISTSSGDVHDAILKAGVIPSSAKVYAEKVQTGMTLMVAMAPFGMAGKAKSAIADIPSVDAGVKHQDYHSSVEPPSKIYRQPPSAELLNVTFMTGEKLPYSGQRWLPFESVFKIPSLTSKTMSSGLITEKLFTTFMPMIIKKRET